MEPFTFRLAALIFALTVTAALTGAAIYEQSVLDPVWPRNPSLVRPREGGVHRKPFWVPANIAGILSLVFAVWAGWPVPSVRNATLLAAGLFLVIIVATAIYFVPGVLRVENTPVPPNDPASLAWVRHTHWRLPFALGANISLAVAIVRAIATR